MFGRKKKTEDKRKRHKGMTEEEIKQLQEVGQRRGFWGARKTSTKRDKRPDISGPINIVTKGNGTGNYKESDMISLTSSQGSPQSQRKLDEGNFNQNGSQDSDDQPHKRQSVKEKAAMYGKISTGPKQQQSFTKPMPAPAANVIKRDKSEQKHPVPPVRKKSWKSSSQPDDPTNVQIPVVTPKPRVAVKPQHIKDHPPAQQPVDYQATGDNNFNHRGAKVVVLQKRQSGDFGFSLRRSSVLASHPSKGEIKKNIYFAEPGPSGGDIELKHGDRLLEIDGWNVEDRNRDELVAKIKSGSDKIRLLVVPSPAPIYEEENNHQKHNKPIEVKQPGDISSAANPWKLKNMVENDHNYKAKNDGAPKTPLPPQLEQDSSSNSSPSRRSSVAKTRKESCGELISVGGVGRGTLTKKKSLTKDDTETISPVTANELHASSIPSQNIEKINPVVTEVCNVVNTNPVVTKVNTLELKQDTNGVANSNHANTNGATKRKRKKSKIKKSSSPVITNETPVKEAKKPEPILEKSAVNENPEVIENTSPDVERNKNNENLQHEVSQTNEISQATENGKKESPNVSENDEQKDTPHEIVDEAANQLAVAEKPNDEISSDKERVSCPIDVSTNETLTHHNTAEVSPITAPPTKPAGDPVVESLPVQVEEVAPTIVFNEEEWEEAEATWCIQKDGFFAAHILKQKDGKNDLKDGQVRVKLDETNQKIVVSEDALENINPASLDRSEDLLSLRHLNECGILHTLRQRFNGNLMYTYAGPHLLNICPPQRPTQHSDKVIEMFKGCRRSDMPPHIYSAAQVAYKELISTKTDQSLVLMGRSGSGKSQCVRHVLSYLVKISGSDNTHLTVGKLHAAMNILESLSSAGTDHCVSATRCVHMYSIDINKSGQLTGGSVQAMLLEKSRVARRPAGEENFRIFYQLLEGASDSLMRELFLVSEEQNTNTLLHDEEKAQTEAWRDHARMGFKTLQEAFETLKFTSDETKAVFNIIAACLHLGMAGANRVSAKYQFAKPDAAQKASSLLGISIENLSRTIFQSQQASLSPSMSPNSPRYHSDDGGLENLQAFIVGLYNEVFRIAVSLINRELSSNLRAQNSLLIVDNPGVQYSNGRSLNDLVYNYTQERVNLVYHHETFTRLKDRYNQENVTCDTEELGDDVDRVSLAIDVPPSQQRTGKNIANDKKGLMWLLDEEAMINGASEDSFIERLILFFGHANKNEQAVIERVAVKNRFRINHFLGACPVEYNATNWLKLSRENQTEKTAIEVLQDSKKKYINVLFGGKISGGLMQGSVVGLEGGGLMLRRAASMRKAWSGASAASVKKKSLPLIKKLQVDSLMDAIRRTNMHFIICAKPYDLTKASSERIVDVNGLRSQLRCFQLLQAARVAKQGFVEHCVYAEFRQNFEVICRQMNLDGQSNRPQTSTGKLLSSMDDKEATEAILQEVGLAKSQYKMGMSQVLLRYGTLANLEDRRNEKVSNIISLFQARCRGYLARKLIEQKKVQTVAVRCIQRNIRKFIEVREWPWWRLLNKVLPLVTVRQTEEELKEKEAELEIVNFKYNKAVTERDELKQLNEKYEAQIHEMSTELAEEKSTGTNTTDLLEQETVERMRLEKELSDMQSIFDSFKQKYDVMEVELAEQKLLHSHNHGPDSSDEELDASEYKMKYEREKREAKFQQKKMSNDYEEQIEQLRSEKKQLERKIHQLEEDVSEQERVANNQKKKAQRLLQELNDGKIHFEEVNAKNHELEKKQRKFDSELYSVQADLTEAKSAKEKLQREKEKTSIEVYDMQQQINEKNDSIESLERKIKSLEEELEETTLRDSEDGQMVNSLKKQKRELEAKVKDQEEELDEQAGTIQLLQQSKERLEMNNERQRQQNVKEIENKDEELEEMRQSFHKKIKLLETQVEEEEEERSRLQRSKKDLEQRMQAMQDQQPSKQRDAESERRLRKDLKRYKALLADAQTMIDHLKTDAVNKQQLRALNAKLEESEYNCSIAVKGKKSIELELEDVQAQLEEITKAKQECEERISYLQRENHEMNSKMEEDEDDNKELTRKYKQLVVQQSDDKKMIVEINSQLDDLKRVREMSNEKIQSLQNQLQYMEENTTDKSNMTRVETKARDLEMKLDFEKTSARRLEVQLTRVKEQLEKQKLELESLRHTEQREKDQVKRLQKQIRESQEEQAELIKKEQDALQKKHELVLQLEESNNQSESLQSDLKLAFKRIADLQAAFEDMEDSDLDEYSSDDSSDDSDSDAYTTATRRRGVASVSSSFRSSVADTESLSSHLRSLSPDESKFSDSSTSTVRSFAKKKLSIEERKKRQKQAKKRLIKELKDCKKSGDSFSTCGGDFDLESFASKSVADNFAEEDGRSTVLSSRGALSRNTDVASTMSNTSERSSYKKGSLMAKIGTAGGVDAIKLELDRMSRSLANEDPSLLLYGNPKHISDSLGLGKTKSFRDLNESIMAVKSRQNLPDKQKNKRAIEQKVEHEISDMKMDTTLNKIYSRRRQQDAGNMLDDDDLYQNDEDIRTSSRMSRRPSTQSYNDDSPKYRTRSQTRANTRSYMGHSPEDVGYGSRGRTQNQNSYDKYQPRSQSVQGSYKVELFNDEDMGTSGSKTYRSRYMPSRNSSRDQYTKAGDGCTSVSSKRNISSRNTTRQYSRDNDDEDLSDATQSRPIRSRFLNRRAVPKQSSYEFNIEDAYYTDSDIPTNKYSPKSNKYANLDYETPRSRTKFSPESKSNDFSSSLDNYELPRRKKYSPESKSISGGSQYSDDSPSSSKLDLNKSSPSNLANSRYLPRQKGGITSASMGSFERTSQVGKSYASMDLESEYSLEDDDVSLSQFGVRTGRSESRARSNYGSDRDSSVGSQRSRSYSRQRMADVEDDPVSIDDMINKYLYRT